MKYFFMAVLVPVSIIAPISFGMINYRHLTASSRVLLFYLFISGLFSAIVVVMAARHLNNLPLFHCFTIIEFCMLVFFFLKTFHSTVVSRWLIVTGSLFVIFTVVNTIFIQDIYTFNTYSRSAEALIIIAVCLYYLRLQLFTGLKFQDEPAFWFVLGLLLYFSTSLTVFILSNISLRLNWHFDWAMWNVHAGMLLLMYLLFTKGFIIVRP